MTASRDVTKCHRVKGGTTDEAFQERSFLWERGASVGADFDLLTFKIFHKHKNPYNTLKERRKRKQISFKAAQGSTALAS